MAFFAVFHLWAFPWAVYDVRRSDIVAAESAAGYIHDPKTAYQGGKFGERALLDAFNPWDIVKMTARGFRWLFVGVRSRHDDVSYQDAAGGKSDTAYGPVGPTFAATGEAATELADSKDDTRGRRNTYEEDRAGLLHSGAAMGRMPSSSPYRSYDDGAYTAFDSTGSPHLRQRGR